jgi:protein TonB
MDNIKIKLFAVGLSLVFHLSFLFGSLENENFSDKKTETLNSGKVVFNIPKKEKIVKKKPKPKKVLPKKKPPKKKAKKVEPVKEEKPVEKPQEVVEEKVVQKATSTDRNKITQDEIEAKKNLFYSRIKERINRNKIYPKTARRRGIQGEVTVTFFINNSGELIDVRILDGKKVFKKSALSAIKNSFPIDVPNELKESKFEFNLVIEYRLI